MVVNVAMPESSELDPLTCPISGTVLVEASAGTGKTYCLSSLFLRLLFERGLHVSEILVVTFTNPATEELKERIRQKLRHALRAFGKVLKSPKGPYSEDPFVDSLCRVWEVERIQDALELARDAIRDFDQASIHTIHGFCHRLLYENAFETGQPFDSKLLTSEQELRREVALDFYRSRLHGLPEKLFYNKRMRPSLALDLLEELLSYQSRHPELKVVPTPPQQPPLPQTHKIKTVFDRLKELWPKEKEALRGLLISWPLNARIYKRPGSPERVKLVDELLMSMDMALWPPWPLLPLSQGLEKLSRSYILAKVNKGHQIDPPEILKLCQEFWEAGEELNEESLKLVPLLKAEFLNFALPRLKALKQRQHVRTFSDLVEAVDHALRGPGGPLLKASINSRYKAALIDEFQDTDPIQFRIFNSLFGTKERPLFLIGDPKQAIYGFRGAEIYTYLQAARKVESRFTLTQNYRSHKGLVGAVNRIFTLKNHPFVFKEIGFVKGTASKEAERNRLEINGAPSAPMKVWLLGEGNYKNKEKLTQLICPLVASEIQRLIELGRQAKAVIDGRPLKSSDLAVLVRTNLQAAQIQQALNALGIHSVVYGGQSVWNTAEADELERILWAVATPEDEGLLRGALATTILGATADQLHGLLTEAPGPGSSTAKWDLILERFKGYRALWQEQGFVVMMGSLIRKEGIKARLLGQPYGERRLTNLLHLVELIQQALSQRRMGISGLLRWMGDQRRGGNEKGEASLMRLESDEEAVKILTIYKSKGLEFPVVFCPFAWDSKGLGRHLLFHPKGDEMVCLDLGSSQIDEHAKQASREKLSEELRLLYVALTRARSCCYLVLCPYKSSEPSGLDYLFSAFYDHESREPGFEKFKEGMKKILGGNEFDFTLPPQEPLTSKGPPASPQNLRCRVFDREVPKDWSITSFTALAGQKDSPELPDHDTTLSHDLEPIQWAEESLKRDSFLYFPRGTRAGSFIHNVLEGLDFSHMEPGVVEDLVGKRLEAFGFEKEWKGAVCQMLMDLVNTPLDPSHPGLTFSQIGMNERLNELEFSFPIKKIDPQTLTHLLGLEGTQLQGKMARGSIGKLTFAPVRGFMKGFIDMVFRWDGRFFLVDWKSNYLGPLAEDYGPESLKEAMVSELYVLQYHIYALALHQYLKARIKDYDYSEHFGGVYYVFLRGINRAWGVGKGIFRDRPDERLIEELARAMIDHPSYPPLQGREKR